jgi:hypothetical protein
MKLFEKRKNIVENDIQKQKKENKEQTRKK